MTFAITSAVMGQASQLSGCLPASCAARPVDKLVPPICVLSGDTGVVCAVRRMIFFFFFSYLRGSLIICKTHPGRRRCCGVCCSWLSQLIITKPRCGHLSKFFYLQVPSLFLQAAFLKSPLREHTLNMYTYEDVFFKRQRANI